MNDHVGAYAYVRTLRNWLFGGPPRGFAAPGETEAPGAPAGATGGGGARPRLRGGMWGPRFAFVWGKPLRALFYTLGLLVFWGFLFFFGKGRGKSVIW